MNAFDAAAYDLEEARIAEAAATARRIECEQSLLRLMPSKAEGSLTERGLHYKVTVTYGVNRTLDVAALDAVRAELPPALFEQAVEYKPAIKTAGLRYLAANEPETYAVLAQAITAKPAKPSVKVEVIPAESARAA